MQTLLREQKKKLSRKSVCKVAMRLLQMLEHIHSRGLVYNNLSLSNILIGDWHKPSIENMKLMDYTLCTKYVDANGQHINHGTVDRFIGNIALSSMNAMNFKTVSRRDDLISLTYLLIIISEGGRSFLNIVEDATFAHFDAIR